MAVLCQINLYKSLKTDAISEFLNLSWSLRYPSSCDGESSVPLEDGTDCPICSQVLLVEYTNLLICYFHYKFDYIFAISPKAHSR